MKVEGAILLEIWKVGKNFAFGVDSPEEKVAGGMARV